MPSGQPASSPHPDVSGRAPDVVAELQARITTTLAEVLPAGHRSWSVVDFPMHFNCGDSALFLGVEAAARAAGATVDRVLDRKVYSAELLTPGSLPVFIPGGTWGGLYPTSHELRLKFLADTRGRPAVQMPQSIEYVDEQHREQLRRAVGAHGALTLLVRDERSLAIATRDYDCAVHLVPDLALALGRLERRPASVPLVVQARTDKEAGDRLHAAETFDWLQAPPRSRPTRSLRTARRLSRLQRRSTSGVVARAAAAGQRRLARANLARAEELLSRGQQVVTDRLHGHVLSTMLGIPHVVVNDRFGKIKALHETWLREDRTGIFVESWEEVDGALEELARTV